MKLHSIRSSVKRKAAAFKRDVKDIFKRRSKGEQEPLDSNYHYLPASENSPSSAIYQDTCTSDPTPHAETVALPSNNNSTLTAQENVEEIGHDSIEPQQVNPKAPTSAADAEKNDITVHTVPIDDDTKARQAAAVLPVNVAGACHIVDSARRNTNDGTLGNENDSTSSTSRLSVPSNENVVGITPTSDIFASKSRRQVSFMKRVRRSSRHIAIPSPATLSKYQGIYEDRIEAPSVAKSDISYNTTPSPSPGTNKIRGFGLRKRVRGASRHIASSSISTLSSYGYKSPHTDTSTISSTTTAATQYSNFRPGGTTPFPFFEANHALETWYKRRPRNDGDRWTYRGVYLILSAAFFLTPLNPLWERIWGENFVFKQGPTYECGNRCLMNLLYALNGDLQEIVSAVECLLDDIYPNVDAHSLLLDIGDPNIKMDLLPTIGVDFDRFIKRLSGRIIPEL
ncbi:hypothetical protein P280DRAFT_520209 [Massarina eburnea CBS 473.64]|uniref:Uncharacterized protein n=1 Tax=Massarina eburnea CBS 473.64 TaxID=1395130 RepID=A0A6A6RSZ8_9PLEO|nr:hypothetical protein P280DRAFT_520209 [Massarina eburnea CBS 473.64]